MEQTAIATEVSASESAPETNNYEAPTAENWFDDAPEAISDVAPESESDDFQPEAEEAPERVELEASETPEVSRSVWDTHFESLGGEEVAPFAAKVLSPLFGQGEIPEQYAQLDPQAGYANLFVDQLADAAPAQYHQVASVILNRSFDNLMKDPAWRDDALRAAGLAPERLDEYLNIDRFGALRVVSDEFVEELADKDIVSELGRLSEEQQFAFEKLGADVAKPILETMRDNRLAKEAKVQAEQQAAQQAEKAFEQQCVQALDNSLNTFQEQFIESRAKLGEDADAVAGRIHKLTQTLIKESSAQNSETAKLWDAFENASNQLQRNPKGDSTLYNIAKRNFTVYFERRYASMMAERSGKKSAAPAPSQKPTARTLNTKSTHEPDLMQVATGKMSAEEFGSSFYTSR